MHGCWTFWGGDTFTKFIYLFHMAIFFIASGFFFYDKSSDQLSLVIKTIKKKVKQLWLPFFIWTAIYVLMHNLFIQINIYTNNPNILDFASGKFIDTIAPYTTIQIVNKVFRGALFSSGEQIFGASWFLKILFMVSVCYLLLDYFAKKVFKKHILLIQLMASISLLALGYFCSIYEISALGIAQTASFYCLYFIGHLLALFKDKYMNWNWKQYLLILTASFVILIEFNMVGSIELNKNYYENPCYLLATSLAGWAFLYSLSYFIKWVPYLNRMMKAIGKRTLSVVILHFLAFKIVAAFVTYYYGLPMFCIAAFPNLYGEKGLWWLIYTIIGVGVPVTANVLYHIVVKKLLSLKNS